MKKLQDLLNKLDQITFTSCEDFELIAGDCWRVKINFSFDNTTNTVTPINVVLDVYYNGSRAAFWGCVGRTDIDILRLWFLRKKAAIDKAKYNLRETENKLASQAFNNL